MNWGKGWVWLAVGGKFEHAPALAPPSIGRSQIATVPVRADWLGSQM